MAEKTWADKIMDFIEKASLVKIDRPPEMSEEDIQLRKENLKEKERRGMLNREDTEGIFSKAMRWISKPYTRDMGIGRDDPNQTVPTKAGYKY